MWKVFLVISTVVLVGAGYFAFQNKGKSTEIRTERVRNDELATKLEKDLDAEKVKLAETNAAVLSLKDEAEQLKTKIAQAEAKGSELQLQADTMKKSVEVAVAKLKDDKEFLKDIPDIESTQKEIQEAKQKISKLEAEVSGVQNAIAQAKVQQEQLVEAAEGLRKLKEDQEAGRIRGEFSSVIKKAYNQWGFVVIDGGNDQGVVNRAQLDVKRRGAQICKLIVTTVEPGEAVAEVVPGSLAPGQTIQEGDVVTKSAIIIAPPKPIEVKDAPAPGGTAPATDNPFGPSDPAPAMEAPDPFGTPAPAAEPAAPAADDPFAAPAPAAPATPAPADDPFAN